MTEQGKKKIVWGVFAAFIAFMVLGAVLSNTPEAKEKQATRDEIAWCWKDQARKSLEPADARFRASICESVEAKFIAKYGEKP